MTIKKNINILTGRTIRRNSWDSVLRTVDEEARELAADPTIGRVVLFTEPFVFLRVDFEDQLEEIE